MSEAVLSVKNLTTHIKLGNSVYKLVNQVSFDLHPGKTLAVVGESGCGKTMTALSIMRILPGSNLWSEGEIWFQGKNLISLPEREMRHIRGAKIAMIFQDPSTSLNPVFTVGNQLQEVAEMHLGLYGEEGFYRVINTLKEVNIPSPEEIYFAYPHQLSGGMRQRAMIAMALMCEPDILIADEPTTALDVTIQAQVLDLIRELQKKKQMALLLITHDMGVVAEIADEVIVMYASEVMESGPVQEIFDHPAHPYTIGLFESRPSMHKPKTHLPSIKGNIPPIRHIPKGCPFHTRCPFVMEKCKQGKVPDFKISPSHFARCWLHEKPKGPE